MREIKQATGQAAGQATGQPAGQAAGQAMEFGLGQAPALAADQGVQSERRRVEAVVETLATLRSEGVSLAELAHDARNMVTAMGLYCDLLEEPGVLATQFTHYGSELRLVAAASRRLVEKLVALDVRGSAVRGVASPAGASRGSAARAGKPARQPATLQASRVEVSGDRSTPKTPASATTAGWAVTDPLHSGSGFESDAATATPTGPSIGPAMAVHPAGRWDLMPPVLISNLAQELLQSRNLLSALAGPSIALSVDVEGGALAVRLNSEDLTRVLVNLVKNAAEAMPAGGSIRLGLRKRHDLAAAATGADSNAAPRGQTLSLTIEDNGTGIPRKALERIFEAGFTTHAAGNAIGGGWHSAHRGLGLSITRSIVEAAGGRIYASNREGSGTPGRGARFEIVLPVRGI